MIPPDAQRLLDDLVARLRDIFGSDLVGVYAHGSLALGCYGPRSDVDVIAVSRRPATDEERRMLMLAIRHPVEFHLLLEHELRHWRHPFPFDFHRGRRGLDHDLAAHVTVAGHTGIALCGPPAAEVFPAVPAEDYADAVRREVAWALGLREKEPLYLVLTLPRIWATLSTGEIYSKASAAEWALPQLPQELRPVLEHALAVYRGETAESWAGLPVDDYVDYLLARIS
ncbi:MAG TPA: aminoglycoside adenylyltransferase domain-containing protein [Gaiellaceae bacterium]|nr:aminoglycoside adenylyltransferase domain-containing protein [Gaiellaceae bacterium]